jgi:hypothetical protein
MIELAQINWPAVNAIVGRMWKVIQICLLITFIVAVYISAAIGCYFLTFQINLP